ncbi:N-acetylmuramoyl-L-alanine amidase [Pseudomonas sp. GOM7]|uniref:N-acetylmuramoyl-L-alanine amidase n=1 Tax=unclassified Pseudomonas TaxID=196821 RepID=UPI00227A7447|nr:MULTISPECIES: N-acetylmuramoyl-L-alanine amidase [unclassified Pseudomonas]WAJ35983.1 N-acetylmuramoyl-L-alanine amidase [Pseudomonas sp. GOM7]
MDRRKFLQLLVAGVALPASFSAQAAQSVRRVRLSQQGGKSILTLELSGPVKANSFSLDAPPRLVIDLHNARLAASLDGLSLAGTPINAIRSGLTPSGDLRIVLDLVSAELLASMPPMQQVGHDLRLQLPVSSALASVAAAVPPVPGRPSNRDLLIVIDAGHGGKDPGAVGAKGEKEKIVALQIATLLARHIDRQKGYKARLTRSSDVFIPLRKRAELAQRLNADLFVSVHADAAPRRSASGASVFALSERGATSSMARWIAQRENEADFIGGGLPAAMQQSDPMLAGVLLDMSMTATISTSLDLGHQVLQHLGAVAGVHQSRVEQAGFAVLKSAAVPSILVETGFISNAGDCKRLHEGRHQRKVAEAIFAGVEGYFRERPPAGSLIAAMVARQQA